ncbi:MAG TPA: ribosome small subunit-dependent GTPase A [Longimicrobiales bacterium]
MPSKASRPDIPFNGIVLWATGGVYHTLLDTGQEVEAALRGRLKQEKRTGDTVVAGDRVYVESHQDGSYSIEAVAARKSEIARRAPGQGSRRAKVLVANVDQVAIVIAAAKPEPRLRMLDRMLILAEANEVPAVIIINKVDLVDADTLNALFADYERAGYELMPISVKQEIGLEHVRARMRGRETVLTGPSGVGKSTLLNYLHPEAQLRTREVSEAVMKGQHTTVGAHLIHLPEGGFIVDTPGMREVGMWEINPDGLDVCFPDFRPFLGDCRFSTCTHLHEPGCAIKIAVESGALSRARYESYRDLYAESAQGNREY